MEPHDDGDQRASNAHVESRSDATPVDTLASEAGVERTPPTVPQPALSSLLLPLVSAPQLADDEEVAPSDIASAQEASGTPPPPEEEEEELPEPPATPQAPSPEPSEGHHDDNNEQPQPTVEVTAPMPALSPAEATQQVDGGSASTATVTLGLSAPLDVVEKSSVMADAQSTSVPASDGSDRSEEASQEEARRHHTASHRRHVKRTREADEQGEALPLAFSARGAVGVEQHDELLAKPATSFSRDEALVPDAATRAQVGDLQRLLLSLFPPSIRALQSADCLVKAEEENEASAKGTMSTSLQKDDGDEVVAAHAQELLELLDAVAEDKMFVHGAWHRCQDAHQLRRQRLSKRRHQSALSRLTGSGSATQRRRQKQQQQHEEDEDEEGPLRSVEDSPLDLFHFLDWDAQSCWRHYTRKSQAGARRGASAATSNQSPFLNAMLQDREEYMEIVSRQLGDEAVPATLPVTLPMMLPAKEAENYARYVLSSGKLRRECLEPFQYLSTRARVVREELLAQYQDDQGVPHGH